MAVISVMMLTAAYNAYLSYDYEWIRDAQNREIKSDNAADILAGQAFRDWAGARTVQAPWIGIKVSIDDAAVLGSAVLFVFSLWLLLAARRENHTIGFLLRDTDTPRAAGRSRTGQPPIYSGGQRWLIFHSIASNSFFLTCDPSLSRVTSLKGANPLKVSKDDVLREYGEKLHSDLVRQERRDRKRDA